MDEEKEKEKEKERIREIIREEINKLTVELETSREYYDGNLYLTVRLRLGDEVISSDGTSIN